MDAKKRLLIADCSLFVIAVAWGYTFVLTKDVLMEITPFYFTGARFFLAALPLLLVVWKAGKKIDRHLWRDGLFCGVVLCLAFTLQIYGISLTTPGKAGVITGMNVILVPILAVFLTRLAVPWGVYAGSLLAFLGMLLLSFDGNWTGLTVGDLLVFLCAVCFALHVILVDRAYQNRPQTDALAFTLIQLLVVGFIDLALGAFLEPVPKSLSPYGWYAFFFDCFVGTLFAYLVQIKAQQYAPSTHVSLILSLESAFAFVFSCLLWGEKVTSTIVTGVLLMLAGIAVTVWTEERKRKTWPENGLPTGTTDSRL